MANWFHKEAGIPVSQVRHGRNPTCHCCERGGALIAAIRAQEDTFDEFRESLVREALARMGRDGGFRDGGFAPATPGFNAYVPR